MFEQMRCSHVRVIFVTVLEVVLGVTLRFVYVPETLPLCFWAQRSRMRRRQPSRGSVKPLASREAHKIKIDASSRVGGEGAAQR